MAFEFFRQKLTNRNSLLPAAYVFLRAYIRHAGRRGIVAAVLVVLGALLEGVGLVLLVPLLAVVFGTVNAGGWLQSHAQSLFDRIGAESAFDRLVALLVLFGSLMIVRAIVISVREVKLARLQIGFVKSERLSVTQSLATAGWEQVERLRHARVTHVMSGDIDRIAAASHFMVQGLMAATMLAVQCVLAFLLSPPLAAIAILLLLLGSVSLVPVLRRARILGNKSTEAYLGLLDDITQFLGALKLAISQDLQSQFVSEFRNTLEALTQRQIAYIRQHTNSQLALTTVSALVGGVLVLVGFASLHIEPAILITLLVVIARMSGPAGQIQQGSQQLVFALPSYDKIQELKAELGRAKGDGARAANTAPLPAGAIVFDAVSFAHRTGEADSAREAGVTGLNLTIQPGEFLGVAGPSGAGKTTFADLLVGLYPPQSGRITVGGIALDTRTLPQWRASLSYISQDPFLFHDTVRRNLTWANPDASDADIWAALRFAGAEELVRHMERGLETVVGERGTLVSGGERQRIALARAILRKPKLIVLDEATSAIDVVGERAIVGNLLMLSPRPTIVMIAHRAESLSRCARVLWFENGHMREGLPAEGDAAVSTGS